MQYYVQNIKMENNSLLLILQSSKAVFLSVRGIGPIPKVTTALIYSKAMARK